MKLLLLLFSLLLAPASPARLFCHTGRVSRNKGLESKVELCDGTCFLTETVQGGIAYRQTFGCVKDVYNKPGLKVKDICNGKRLGKAGHFVLTRCCSTDKCNQPSVNFNTVRG